MTSTTAPSFKMLIKDGTAKRADSMRFRIEDIHEEPGFNLRRTDAVDADGKTLQDHIDDLARHIVAGGIVPPLEVRPRIGGGVFVVDGHRRRRAYLRAEEMGASIRDGNNELWLPVVAFVGNDADRIARVITSAEGRGMTDRRRKPAGSSEHSTQNEIRNSLVDDGMFFRANVGTAWASNDVAKMPDGSLILRNPRPFSTGLPAGFSDLFGGVPTVITPEMVGQTVAILTVIECKSAKGPIRALQERFIAGVIRIGGRAGFARDVETARAIARGTQHGNDGR